MSCALTADILKAVLQRILIPDFMEPYTTFRGIENGGPDVDDVPLKSKYRQCTDVFCLFGFLVIALATLIITATVCSNFNISRLKEVFQSSLNKSEKTLETNCSGKDYKGKNIIQYLNWEENSTLKSECVEKCDDDFIYCNESNICVPNEDFISSEIICRKYSYKRKIEVKEFIDSVDWKKYGYVLLIVPVIVIILWTGLLLLLVLYPHIFVWSFMIIGLSSLVVMLTTALISLNASMSYLVLLLICIVILIGIMISQRRNVNLAIDLLSLVGHIFIEVPSLICFKILCILGTAGIAGGLLALHFWTITWKDQSIPAHLLMSVQTVLLLWVVLICDGISYFVFSGVVGKWYFERHKIKTEDPLFFALGILFRYHIGSVIFGAALILIIKILRFIAKESEDSDFDVIYKIIDSCLGCVEGCVEIFQKNAFVLMVLHGRSLIPSGRRAFVLIGTNAIKFLTLNIVICVCTASALFFISSIPFMIFYFFIQVSDDPKFNLGCAGGAYALAVLIGLFCISILDDVFKIVFMCYLEATAMNKTNANPQYAALVLSSKEIVGERQIS